MTFFDKDEMKSWFQRQGYPEDVINTEIKKVIFNGNSSKSSNKRKSVSFLLTYHPLLHYLSQNFTSALHE